MAFYACRYPPFLYGRGDRITDEHLIYTSLSDKRVERRSRYRDFVRGVIKEKKAMKGELDRRVVYSRENFIKIVSTEYKVEAVIKPQGRPTREENEDK